MAKIPDGTLRNWNNGDIMLESDYEQEREILRVAINDNHDRIVSNDGDIENLQTRTTDLESRVDDVELNKANKSETFTKAELQSVAAGTSGADLVQTSPIEGVPGANVRQVLQELKYQINSAVTGTIPDGSIGKEKLSFEIATDDKGVTVTDDNNHFSSSTLAGVLDELFTSADSVKTNVANAIGSPAAKTDDGATLAGYITSNKTTLASEIGDGTAASTLAYLVGRLTTRLDELSSTVNTKGITSTNSDTLAQLVTKVSQIISLTPTQLTSFRSDANNILGS